MNMPAAAQHPPDSIEYWFCQGNPLKSFKSGSRKFLGRTLRNMQNNKEVRESFHMKVYIIAVYMT